jgi:hypothetical protein
MSTDNPYTDHLSFLKRSAGPIIIGSLLVDTPDKISISTPYGIYDVSRGDVLNIESDVDGKSKITISRGAKILFSRLMDAESLLPGNRASLAHVAQGAKHLQFALNRVLGKTELPTQSSGEASVDCPMSDCTDCCECPVIGGADETQEKAGIRTEYYERQIGREPQQGYRKDAK